jgi:hypothetical protein
MTDRSTHQEVACWEGFDRIDQEAGVLGAMDGPPGGGSEAAGASIGDLGGKSKQLEERAEGVEERKGRVVWLS